MPVDVNGAEAEPASPNPSDECQQKLAQCEQRFLHLAELSSDWYWEQDEHFRFSFFSGLLMEKTGLGDKWHLGKYRWDTPAPNLSEEDWARHKALLERHEPFFDFEIQRLNSDGREVWASISGRPVFDDRGRFTGYSGVGKDITARKLAERALRASEARFRALTNLSSDWYWEQDAELRFTVQSGRSTEYLTLKLDEDVGKRLWELPIVGVSDERWQEHRETVEARKSFRDFEYERRSDEGMRILSISGEPVFDEQGRFTGYRGIGRDVTERRQAEQRIQYLAFHDGLTTLPNRASFSNTLEHAVLTARRYERKLGVLFVDLDRFKNINDTLGHHAGDQLLKTTSLRIRDCLRSSDVVARLGGDEFVVLIEEVKEPKHVATVARKILSAVIEPVVLQEREYRVTASIGICIFPDDAHDELTLMKNADIAMYRAKEEGKNTYKFYSDQINVHSFERLALETSLRKALERGEFFLHYQAKTDLDKARITGVEALVRWNHPDLGPVPPTQFIPLAEETGLIVPIGRWILNTACAQNVAWQRAGLPPVSVAVNLSARQFSDPDLLTDIAEALEESGMNPSLLELELTESMVMQDLNQATEVLNAIKQMGVRIAIDDFGVGYSSLANLKRFPINILKVDRSFIQELPDDSEDKAIAQAIIAMGKTLQLTVVAEGVETEAQHTFLRTSGCHEMQGYFFSEPLDAEDFATLLALQKH